jgi:hypothetical protein
MTDNTKDNFSRAVAEFEIWKSVPESNRRKSPPWWRAALLPLMENSEPLPGGLTAVFPNAATYGECAQAFYAGLVVEDGPLPSSGWTRR